MNIKKGGESGKACNLHSCTYIPWTSLARKPRLCKLRSLGAVKKRVGGECRNRIRGWKEGTERREKRERRGWRVTPQGGAGLLGEERSGGVWDQSLSSQPPGGSASGLKKVLAGTQLLAGLDSTPPPGVGGVRFKEGPVWDPVLSPRA